MLILSPCRHSRSSGHSPLQLQLQSDLLRKPGNYKPPKVLAAMKINDLDWTNEIKLATIQQNNATNAPSVKFEASKNAKNRETLHLSRLSSSSSALRL